MSQAQRLALIVAAVVVLGVGFVLANGGGDDEKKSTASTATTTVTTAAPATTASTGTAAAPATTTTAPTATTTPAAPAVPTVVVDGGKPEGGVKKLEFAKGDQVAFKVSSDVADEIHVHGYDLMKDVKAGGSVSFSFKGDIDGIFEVELEGAGVQIAELKVTP